MTSRFPVCTALLCICLIPVLFGCKKSTEEEFNQANGTIPEKYINRFEVVSTDVSENKTFIVNYDGENRVSSIVEGGSANFFNYNSNNNLTTVESDGEILDVNELYQSPYDAFESGNVLEYDLKGNPKRIEVYEDGYNTNILIGELTYDDAPNPFFYTLKAAGIIDVLDRVDLNFGVQSPTIIKAKKLLPYNNIRAMIFKDIAGNTKQEIQINYTYNADKYPIQATVNVYSPGESTSYLAKYYYK